MKPKLFTQLSAGMLGGTLLGMVGLLWGMDYGANHSFWRWLNELLRTANFESWGLLGAIVAMVLGCILGLMLGSFLWVASWRTALILLLATLILPWVGNLVFLGMDYVVLSLIFGSMVLSAIILGVIRAISILRK